MFRLPLEYERACHTRPDEIVAYEAFFALGMRDRVPSLIAEVAKELGVSLGQFTPSSWRVLTAIQIFGELFSVEIGAKDVLFTYDFRAHGIDKHRCVVHRRSSTLSPLMYDIKRSLRGNASYEKDWTKRFLFMKVDSNSSFTRAWSCGDFKRETCLEGELYATQVISVPEEYRLVTSLLKPFALGKSTIWRCPMSSFL